MLSVRELQHSDLDKLISYWVDADPEFMKSMGVDMKKMPDYNQWQIMLSEQLNQNYENKKSYCIIWLQDDVPVGHSNVNKIIFGKEAYLHLHLWNLQNRKNGMGSEFVKMTIPFYFRNLQLQTLYCEPYALNSAPNKTLVKIGFKFLNSYTCIPGWLNFEQEVNLWELRKGTPMESLPD